MYVAFVRPHLEYAQPVWAPHLRKHINLLESVQIRATKLVDGFHNLEYSERIKRLSLPTLVYRRRRGDMIEIFKHFHTYDKETISKSFNPGTRSSRKHEFQLHRNRPQDGTRGIHTNSFYNRTQKIWNDLPADVVNAEDVNAFKNKLDKLWENHPTKYDYTYRDILIDS